MADALTPLDSAQPRNGIGNRDPEPRLDTGKGGVYIHRPSDFSFGRLAQLVRAPGLHPGGRGFESLISHQPLWIFETEYAGS